MKRFFDKLYHTTGFIADPSQRSVASHVSSLLLQGSIAFSLLGTIGVDTSPLVAAAGVIGATAGFACKDFGANFIASIVLSSQPSLRTGNRISIGTGAGAVKGEVVDWDTRYLYLRTSEGHLLHVPNSMILTSIVTWESSDSKQRLGGGNEPQGYSPTPPHTVPCNDSASGTK
ncbi:Mechanosensitive ion channel [Trypanosoma brucei equiperdum]|uniref:Mechanosensitive ion channel n=1 Tax=Trypanosoma brucei equiperdum TaxID=630700 RepID=A0A3L6L033_9TRYP|nr:Mechanosensitive ion channel [Trypanosoma brucei equiperdum]